MSAKKLLVLDVNGLLIDTYFHKEPLPEESPDARVGNFYVYKRPFCQEFLQFCLDNFIVGIWSSAREYNVNNLVDYVFGDAKERLAFSWHQSDCTDVGLKAPDNQQKPLFMKELSKLWRKVKVELPWNEGDYGPLNTLLVDDTPYKAVLNPPNTAIFPRSYTVRDHGDNFLGGALRSYLEGIRDAVSVQTYVENNPFGEPSITPESPLWSHVSEVLSRVTSILNKVTEVTQVLPSEVGSDDISEGRPRRSRCRKWKGYLDTLQLTNDDTSLSCQESLQRTGEDANVTQEGQASISGPTFQNSKQLQSIRSGGLAVELNNIQEQQGEVVNDVRKEDGQQECGDSTFKGLESESMGVDDHAEWCKELISPREESCLHTLKDWEAAHNLIAFTLDSSVEHKRVYGGPIRSHDKRKYSDRDDSDYRQKGSYQDKNRSGYNQDSKRPKGWFFVDKRHNNGYAHCGRRQSLWHDNYTRDNKGHHQNWNKQRQGGRYNALPFNGRDPERGFPNERLEYEEGRRYVKRDDSFVCGKRVPTDYNRRASNTPSTRKAMHESKISAEPHQSRGRFHVSTTNSHAHRHTQDEVPSSGECYGRCKPKVVYERESVWPHKDEHQSSKTWHKKECRASSEPYRDAGVSSWSSRRGMKLFRLPSKSNGASRRQHHSSSLRSQGW